MSNIITIEKNKNKKLYKQYAEQIIKTGARGFCASEINNDFLTETLELSDYLIIHSYNNTIRGFACIDVIMKPEKHVYIHLICNVKHHNMQTRKSSSIKYSGKHIIQHIISLAKKKRAKYVKLSAINNVITYYYNLGFNFDSPDLIHDTRDELLNKLKIAQKNKDEKETELILNKIVSKYFKGFYNEKRQQIIGEDEEKNRYVVGRDDGIPMIYYIKQQKSVCVGKTKRQCKNHKICTFANGLKRKFCRTRKKLNIDNI